MFLDEARLVARISHPNVVPTLDVVHTGGELFIVMEYVRGESLARLIRAAKTDADRRIEQAVEWIAEGKGRDWKYESSCADGEGLRVARR